VGLEGAPGIGVLRERHLHAAVKRWYAEPGDREEVPVDGYVIDLVRGDSSQANDGGDGEGGPAAAAETCA